jgi:hypothetical protein
MNKKVIWIEDDNVFVVSRNRTSNNKIIDKGFAVQTYTFSREQYELANSKSKFGMKDFFSLDKSNCLDCKFSLNSGEGGCYTHKYFQYSGFLRMLRSIDRSKLTPLDNSKYVEILDMSRDTYVRFGTYGEPSLLPEYMIYSMSKVSSAWTGYTHQWKKEWAKGLGRYFMASTHNQEETDEAKKLDYRSFIATLSGEETAVGCPASKEMGYVSNCAKCGLCSGTEGKGSKDVKILMH